MSKDFRITLTNKKQIILYLSNYYRYRTKLIVTNEISQKGISNACGIRLEHVSRNIKTLIQDDLIYKRSARMIKTNRTKKAYFLTKKGKKYISQIKKVFNNKKIIIRTLDDELREIQFSQLKDFIDIKIQLLDVYNVAKLSKDNIVDLKKLKSIKT